jgi:hypothetical protein
MDNIFTALELCAVTMAALCRDANHAGLANPANERAELPLGILFSRQSVREARQCAAAISAVSRPPCNIFYALEPADFAFIWTTIIALVMATDISKHFERMKTMNERLDGGYDTAIPEDRILTLELILKCGAISDVARPFELAEKLGGHLCEEFFRYGDLEAAAGMQFTSPRNRRVHLDKAKSRIGFYKSVCLPLFQATARAIPALECNVKQVESNLAIWAGEAEPPDIDGPE